MSQYYIGIDGGGTKTAFGLFDQDGHLIKKQELSTCHFLQVGFAGCAKLIRMGIEDILENIHPKDVMIGIGIAGYGEDQEIRKNIEKELAYELKDYSYIITNDVHIALIGAFCNQDGILVIAGTGTIAYVKKGHKLHRVGGWGYQLGDEGSAYWIGKQLLNEFCKQADGRIEKDDIYKKIMEIYHLKNPYEIIQVIHEMKNERTQIAQLSLLCDELANTGHKICHHILQEAGQYVFELAYTLSKQYGIKKISHGGSLFNNEIIKEQFISCVQKHRLEYQKPYADALYGAYLFVKNS